MSAPLDPRRLLSDLVAIDSVNPELVPGGAGEAAIASYVAGWMEDAGLEVSIEEVEPERPNVIGVRRGRGDGRTLLLAAHTDTVGIGGMDGPHDVRVDGDRLYGRGAYDMKAGLAAAMLTAAAVDTLAGDVVVAAVCDEEAGGRGTRALLAQGLRPDAAVVTEPTELRVAVAHKGFVGFEIETRGRAAHGSRPDEGIDAIAMMGPVLVELAAYDKRLEQQPAHALLGRGSVHSSLIEGGQEFSTYPGRCLLKGERRSLPGETSAGIKRELREVIERAGVEADLRLCFAGAPFEAPRGHDIVHLLELHAATETCGLPFWADSALLAEAGIPTVLFGPSGEGAHADIEWVSLRSVEQVQHVLTAVAQDFCGLSRS